jgi:hypothetical protein
MNPFFDMSFSGKNLIELVYQIAKLPQLSAEPSEVSYDNGKKLKPREWPEGVLSKFTYNFFVTWGDGSFSTKTWVSSDKSYIVKIYIKELQFNLETFREVASDWNWEIVSIIDNKLFFPWEDDYNYNTPSFGDLHHPFTTGCAFKGDGHNRIPSRRFLEYGPWRTIRDEARDITFIQFHDLEADVEIALEQARVGHALLDRNITGGLRGSIKIVALQDKHNLYDPNERSLTYIITDEEPTAAWYIEACAIKAYQLLETDMPVDRIKFMFPLDPEQAQKYLHDLWLYGLECWVMPDGQATRLDDTYTPPSPNKPNWVQELELK